MKIAIEENKKEAKKLLDNITELFNTLSFFAENENMIAELKTRIKYKGIYFRQKAEEEKH